MTDEPRNVHVTLRSWDESFKIPATDFIKELQTALGEVPEQHRDSVVVEFDRWGGDYECSRGELSLHYSRPETDDERRARVQFDQRQVTEKEASERRELARLKAKYEEPKT